MKTIYLTKYDDKVDVILQSEEGKCERLHGVESVGSYGVGCFVDLSTYWFSLVCDPPTDFVDLTTSKTLDDAYCETGRSGFTISMGEEDNIMFEAEIDIVKGVTYKIESSRVILSYKLFYNEKRLVTVYNKNIYLDSFEISNLESWSLDSFDYPLNARCALKLTGRTPQFIQISDAVSAKLASALRIDDEYDADKILAALRLKTPEKPSLDIMLNSEQPNIDKNYELNEGNIDRSIPISMLATVTVVFPWE